MIRAAIVVAAVFAAGQSSETFVAALNRALARDDRQAVARMIRFPIEVTIGGVRVSLRHEAAFVEAFDAIFTPDLRALISDGAAIRDGYIQVESVGGVPRITRFASIPASAAVGVPSSARGARASPRRLTFVQHVGQVSGALAPGASDSYVIFAERNTLVTARIDGVRGRDVLLSVLDRKGRPVDARAAGVRAWTGRVPASADYRIEVVRSTGGGGSAAYLLFVRQQ
jgi:hypothetical protein